MPKAKSKPKSKRKPKVQTDLRIPYDECMKLTFRQIKKRPEYAKLTPLGTYYNPSRAYHVGHKSTMRKEELCRTLDNPAKYHEANRKLLAKGKVYGARKRPSRKGLCLIKVRKPPCKGRVYKHKGLTTSGKPCCYKKKQSDRVRKKRARAT